MNCGRTIPPTIQLGEWLTSTAVDPVLTVTLDNTWKSSWETHSISQPIMEALDMNSGRTIPPTIPHGKWMTSTVVDPVVTAIQEFGWKPLLLIPSISQPMMEALDRNCGLMIPQIIPHGKYLIFEAVILAAVSYTHLRAHET